MSSIRRTLGISSLLILLAGPAAAQTSYPMLMSLKPTAAAIGGATEHELLSRASMYGFTTVLVSGTGVTGEVLTPMEPGKDGKEPKLESIKLRFTVAADALPGVRDFRLLGPTGASTIGQLVVAQDPVIHEQKDNDVLEKAQNVTLPATLCGTIEKAEDVDYFRFSISQPTTLQFHCRAMRLEDRIHDLQAHVDPLITVRSATGSVVAAADNTYAADPLLSCPLDRPGEYVLEVRDSRYQGNVHWTYSVEANDRPFIKTVHPVAVAAGAPRKMELVGLGLPAVTLIEQAIPSGLADGPHPLRPVLNGKPTNPVTVLVESLPLADETSDNNTAATATALMIPSAVGGRMETAADVDVFAFEAKKGETFSFEVIARRLDSGLDPLLAIVNEKGQRLQESDDIRTGPRGSQDAWIENWAAPADGKYFVELRDLHLRGGAEFVYALRATRPQPYFDLFLDTDKTQIPPGGAGVLFVRAFRKNGFDGEIALAIEGLPEGITATPGRILAGKPTDGCIILEAAKDRPIVGREITVTGRGQIKLPDGSTREFVATAHPMQEIYMPGGGRSHYWVDQHIVASAPSSDVLEVKLSTDHVELAPGGSAKVDVEIVRAPEFKQNVTLDVLFQHLSQKFGDTLPPGVTIDAKKSSTLLTSGATKGHLMLVAAKDAAPVEKQLCSVMANVSINFVMKATTSSKPFYISVTAAK